jgi:hypothetical protein
VPTTAATTAAAASSTTNQPAGLTSPANWMLSRLARVD